MAREMRSEGSRFSKKRDFVWKAIIEFLCYEYCADYISSSDAIHSGFQWRIRSEILQELNEHQLRENDLPSLYQVLTQFLMTSNKLLEENLFGDQNSIEECKELLEELCSTSSKLKLVGEHLNNLFEDIKSKGVHNTKEEIKEWKNVFVGSRTILVREVLELFTQPYLLKMVQNCNLDYIMETKKGVTAAVDLLKSVHFEAKTIQNWKKTLKVDALLLEIMKNNNHHKATSSPEDSYETATSHVSTISNNIQNISRKISKQMQNHRANEVQLTERNARQRSKESKLITSSYFATPPPLPKLRNTKSQSSWTEDLEMKKPSSPVFSTASRSQTIGPRKRLYWTHEEEELLVLGVEKYNVGNWRLILADGGLKNRTVRDLYDKWKNIQKYGHLDSIKARLRRKCKKK